MKLENNKIKTKIIFNNLTDLTIDDFDEEVETIESESDEIIMIEQSLKFLLIKCSCFI